MEITLKLTRAEMLIAHNALNEICNIPTHIPDWEFQTRMGVTRDRARQVLEKISAALDANPR